MRASRWRRKHCVLLAASLLVAIGTSPTAPTFAAEPPRIAAPDLDLLEYLGRLEGRDGEWVGPEDMAPAADDAPSGSSASRRQANVEHGVRVPAPTPTGEQRHVE